MIARVESYALFGLEGVPVTVEADISKGIPSFDMVGLPDAAVKESRERVKSAVKNSGLMFPNHKITVNYAPAYVKKEGSALDLATAISLLKGEGALEANTNGIIFLGELALNGELRPVRGVLPAVITKRLSFPQKTQRKRGMWAASTYMRREPYAKWWIIFPVFRPSPPCVAKNSARRKAKRRARTGTTTFPRTICRS